MKLNVGDSFLMNRETGPETCVIQEIRQGEGWHQIHYRSGTHEATIHIGLPDSYDEELGCVSPDSV